MSAQARTAPATEASTARTVQTKKWKLNFNELGSGPPVFLLHGTGPGATGWSNFAPNVEPLSQHYRVMALDFPGWGGSDALDPTKEPRNLANAEAIKLLMDELGIEKAAIVGNSMGGAAALQFAAIYPERISHLVTMGSGFFGIPNIFSPGGLSEGLRIIVETYREPTPENFKRLVSVMVYDPSFVTDELCKLRSDRAMQNPENLTNWLKGAGPKAIPGMPVGELMDKMAAFKGRSLFIHGRDDRVVPYEFSLRLISTVPNSRLHVFNRCGHWAQIEHAAEFNSLLKTFLEGGA
jgi:2-hydroxy-6-oxonona-2,4-dienedioate hydrolase